jgi:hypothetical protein
VTSRTHAPTAANRPSRQARVNGPAESARALAETAQAARADTPS